MAGGKVERIIRQSYNQARKRIYNFVFDDFVLERLLKVKIKSFDNYKEGKALNKFAKEYRVPAFYDPNKHTIYYNQRILVKKSQKMIQEILTHELVHAISNHSVVTSKEVVILKSGLRKQYVGARGEKCHFRGFNEGLVQYLCNKINMSNYGAYKGEVYVVHNLLRLLGEEIVIRAFLSDNDFELDRLIRERLGWKWMIAISRKVDSKKYNDAVKMLQIAMNKEKQNPVNLRCVANPLG